MAEDANTGKAEKPTYITPEDFITKHPLYTPAAIAPVPQFFPPDSISYHCDGPSPCGKETTWLRVKKAADGVGGEGVSGFQVVCYVCALCHHAEMWVMYRSTMAEIEKVISVPKPITPLGRIATHSDLPKIWVVTSLEKIGQTPPLSIDLPKPLEQKLGKESAAFYKKALINRNEGNGLAAVTYLRRVIEDKTNELLEVIAKHAEAHEVDPVIVKQIRDAITEKTTYDRKLELASGVLPASMKPGGANPLGELHNLVSQGLHGLSEDQCVKVADEIRSVFEYVFTHLRAETEMRKDFVTKVTKWAGGKGL